MQSTENTENSSGIPRFMIDRSIMFCSPVTVYTAKRDGTFRCPVSFDTGLCR